MKTVRWIEADPCQKAQLPRIPTCYVIVLNGGQAVYIGSCCDLRKRVAQHKFRPSPAAGVLCRWGYFRSATLKYKRFRRYGDWLACEARLIRRIRPSLNSGRGVR